MKLWRIVVLGFGLPLLFSCGGAVRNGGFNYSQKYSGQWGEEGGTHRGSNYYILLNAQGDIVSAQSYSSQGAKCSIAGSVRKTGNYLDLTVVLTVDEGNAACTNVSLSASGRLAFDSGTGWWEGSGTGIFSDDPSSPKTIGFSLARDDDW